jgi:hypothetical protein
VTLGEYLKAPRPAWDWQSQDCCRWVARWIVSQGHADPMSFIGHSYSTRTGALRVIRRGGGLVALWSKGMAGAGLRVTDTPIAGSVAVLSIPTDDGLNEACGIWTGERWGMLHERGLVFGVGAPLKMWNV